MAPRKAVPAKPKPPPEPDPVRKYRVLSRRYVHGRQGEVIELALSPKAEQALLQGGVLELAPEAPEFVESDAPVDDRPLKSAEEEG